MQPCLRWEEGDKKGILCTYDEDSLEIKEEKEITMEGVSANDYLVDRLMGYGSVEIKLTRILAG